MIVEFIKALFFAGIPIGYISYYFVLKTTRNITLKSTNSKELKLELKTLQLQNKTEDNQLSFMLHQKWLKFGGGYYGLLAFITYLHIEVYQVIEFIQNFDGFSHFIESIGLSMILNFFIEALMNLITAFIWPVYWFKFLPIGSLWIWLLVTFVAYTSATKIALQKN